MAKFSTKALNLGLFDDISYRSADLLDLQDLVAVIFRIHGDVVNTLRTITYDLQNLALFKLWQDF